MSPTEIAMLLVIAGVCGSIGQTLVGFERGGCLTSVGIGFVGAAVGLWLGRRLELPELFVLELAGVRYPIVWSIVGATVFVAVVKLLTTRTRLY